MSIKVTAILPTAGSGTRLPGPRSKQFLHIGGKPILGHTLKVFERCTRVDEIILVVAGSDLQICTDEIIDPYGFTKIRHIVTGGPHRQESVYCGLCAIESATDIVVIHDGVRPFVTPDQIVASIRDCQIHGAVTAAVPVKNTIAVAQNGVILRTPSRETLWAIQTPQTFVLDLILKAHEQARSEGIQVTDDAALVQRLGHPVHIMQSSYENIKITTPEDLALAEILFAQRRVKA